MTAPDTPRDAVALSVLEAAAKAAHEASPHQPWYAREELAAVLAKVAPQDSAEADAVMVAMLSPDRVLNLIATLRALLAERDAARDRMETLTVECEQDMMRVEADLTAARAEVARLREALEPFARVAETEIDGDEDDQDWFTTTALKLKVGHFRRALAALEGRADGQ